jgi:hypothetical protein
MRRLDVLLQEYEEVGNWDVDVQRMASTKKAKWKLIMDVIFGHTQTRSIFRFCVWELLVH